MTRYFRKIHDKELIKMLTKYEKETLITYNEEEPTANVYTYNKALIKKLNELADSELVKKDSTGSRMYLIPKSWIKVSPPRKLNLSSEQKKAMRERAKANFNNAK